MNTYKIYSRWLAVELRKQGFKILATDINEYHPQYIVWIFENSPTLQSAITALTQQKRH